MAFEYLPISEDKGASSIENVAVAGMMIHKVIPAQSIEGGMPITEDKGAGSIEAVAAGEMRRGAAEKVWLLNICRSRRTRGLAVFRMLR